MNFIEAYEVEVPVSTFRQNPTQQNIRLAFLALRKHNRPILDDLMEAVESLLKKEADRYQAKHRSSERTKAFLTRYTRFLLVENMLKEADNQEAVYKELAEAKGISKASYKRQHMKLRKEYR